MRPGAGSILCIEGAGVTLMEFQQRHSTNEASGEALGPPGGLLSRAHQAQSWSRMDKEDALCQTHSSTLKAQGIPNALTRTPSLLRTSSVPSLVPFSG